MEYSRVLSLHYEYFPDIDLIRFEDGVCYTMQEAIIISRMGDEDVKAVHLVKKIFGGELLRQGEEPDTTWGITVIPHEPVQVPATLKKTKHKTVPDAEVLKLDL